MQVLVHTMVAFFLVATSQRQGPFDPIACVRNYYAVTHSGMWEGTAIIRSGRERKAVGRYDFNLVDDGHGRRRLEVAEYFEGALVRRQGAFFNKTLWLSAQQDISQDDSVAATPIIAVEINCKTPMQMPHIHPALGMFFGQSPHFARTDSGFLVYDLADLVDTSGVITSSVAVGESSQRLELRLSAGPEVDVEFDTRNNQVTRMRGKFDLSYDKDRYRCTTSVDDLAYSATAEPLWVRGTARMVVRPLTGGAPETFEYELEMHRTSELGRLPENFEFSTIEVPDGTIVSVRNDRGVHYEFRRGQVFKVIDANSIASLEGAQFSRNTSAIWRMAFRVAVVGLCLAVAIWVIRRKAIVTILAFAMLSLPASNCIASDVCPPTLVAAYDRDLALDVQCGLYAALAVLRVESPCEEWDLEHVFSGRYITSQAGSTSEDLVRLFSDFGLESYVVRSMTIAELELLSGPAILLMGRMQDESKTRHWVTYLGGNGTLRILDAPYPVTSVTAAQLSSDWTGIAVVIGSRPHIIRRLAARMDGLLLVLAVASLLWAWRQSFGGSVSPWVAFAVILLVVGTAGVVSHMVMPGGFFRNNAAVAYACRRDASLANDLDIDEFAAVESTIDRVVFVDARMHSAFASGTIQGAYSLPVHGSLTCWARFTSEVAATKSIVVFCESPSCPWAKYVALSLKDAGFKDVKVFSPGVRALMAMVEGK